MHELALIVESLTPLLFYIVRHTDDTGGGRLKNGIVKIEGDAVVNYLTLDELTESRLKTEGLDPFTLVTTNESEKGKRRNRRVKIVKK